MNQEHPISKTNHNRRLLFGILIVAVSGVLIIGGVTVWQILTVPDFSPQDSAVKQTHAFLAAAKENPTGPMPDSIPGYLRGGLDCWTFFQTEMAQDANQYVITVTDVYDAREHPEWREMYEVWLLIDFSDQRRAELYFYQGGLSGCREIKE